MAGIIDAFTRQARKINPGVAAVVACAAVGGAAGYLTASQRIEQQEIGLRGQQNAIRQAVEPALFSAMTRTEALQARVAIAEIVRQPARFPRIAGCLGMARGEVGIAVGRGQLHLGEVYDQVRLHQCLTSLPDPKISDRSRRVATDAFFGLGMGGLVGLALTSIKRRRTTVPQNNPG